MRFSLLIFKRQHNSLLVQFSSLIELYFKRSIILQKKSSGQTSWIETPNIEIVLVSSRSHQNWDIRKLSLPIHPPSHGSWQDPLDCGQLTRRHLVAGVEGEGKAEALHGGAVEGPGGGQEGEEEEG